MTFFSLISTAFSSIVYGVIITAVIMAILYGVLKSISKAIVQTPVFFVTGFVLAFLLVIQTSQLIGAIYAKGAVDSAEVYLHQRLENDHRTVSANDSQRIFESVREEYPIIGSFWGLADYSGHEASELPEVMHDVMSDYLNSYIWHRLWWILGIITVACLIVMLYDKRNPATGKPKVKTRMASRKNYDDF